MKIRQAFVANSSSSSFLIVGKRFKDDESEEATAFKQALGKGVTERYDADENDHIIGFDIDPGIADGVGGDALELLKFITDSFDKLKAVMGDERPTYHGYAGYDG